MLIRLPILKMKPEGEGNNNGGGNSQTVTTTSTQTPVSQTQGNDTLDEFGYPTVETPAVTTTKAEPEVKHEPTTTDDKKKVEPEVKVPGYDDEPDIKDEKKVDPPVEEKKKDDVPALDYKIEVADLHADEIKLVEELAKTHKLTKEQATAVAEMRKADISAMNSIESKRLADQKTQVANLRSGWKTELQNDKVFGGANFAHSMKQAGTVLEKFFPETKKMLDEKKGMLPPSTMRDLQGIHKVLFATEPLIEGDKSSNSNSKDPWDTFYT